jgi:hypothetical protein
METMLRLAAVCALLHAAVAHAAPSLEAAERAAAQVRWTDARAELTALIRSGGLDRATLLGAFELRAEIAAVLEGAPAAEREYQKLLALDPTRPAPRRGSPVFTQPFARARRWVAENRALRLVHRPPAIVATGTPITLEVQLVDPLDLVAGVRAVGHVGDAPFVLGTPPRLPALEPGAVAEYRLEALDGFGNLLATTGETTPFHVQAEAPPAPRPVLSVAAHEPAPALVQPSPPRRRLWPAATGLAGAALAIAVAAVVLNVAARNQYTQLETSCAPHCTPAQLGTFHGEEYASIALYPIAGAAAVTSLVLLIVDRVRHR